MYQFIPRIIYFFLFFIYIGKSRLKLSILWGFLPFFHILSFLFTFMSAKISKWWILQYQKSSKRIIPNDNNFLCFCLCKFRKISQNAEIDADGDDVHHLAKSNNKQTPDKTSSLDPLWFIFWQTIISMN